MKAKAKEKGKKGPCWVCSGDHWKRDCPKKGDKNSGDVGGTSLTKSSTSANDVEDEDDFSFMVEEVLGDEQYISDGDIGSSDEDIENIISTQDEISSIDTHVKSQTQLFDLGVSCHISPHRDEFSTFKTITPQALKTANKQTFSAVGEGEVTLDLPNGATSSKLHLTEVLYSPEAGYTIISIRRLDVAGFTTTFANNKCIIHDNCGARIAEIPRSGRGLIQID